MAPSSQPMSLDRFKGCLSGAVMGDCMGATFEGDRVVAAKVLRNYFDKMDEAREKKHLPYKPYTDDTAMTLALCRSLLGKNAFDLRDLARQYSDEFLRDHNRGYGAAVGHIFIKLADSEAWESGDEQDVLRPAQQQFDGQGSYGNGAAMRVAPIALFHAQDSLEAVIESAHRQSLITHSNGLAVLGAVVQAAAVWHALRAEGASIEVAGFVQQLKTAVNQVNSPRVEDTQKEVFLQKLDCIPKFLSKKSIDEEDFCEQLGNDVTAHGSVPTAVYAFLKALQPTPDYETESAVIRTLFTAIRLGGDTDTIASMAGAIAGAYHGRKDIPTNLTTHCEAFEEAEDFASKLHARIA